MLLFAHSITGLTIHSSRRRFAARLNSGVRPQWVKLGGGSCFGSFPTVCPSAPGAAFHCFRHRQIRSFGLGLSVLCTRRFASFGDSARQGLSGKPRLAGCGIIGLRCVFQAGSSGLRGASRPQLPNHSFKPTWLSPRGLIPALDQAGG